jgi:hypothetical protein
MSTKPQAEEPEPPIKGEHIFPATALTKQALKWKELVAKGRSKEAMEVLEQIVIGSAAMFERLAQHENFHYTVDLPILVSAAQEKVPKWLLAWEPKKGRLFSWFSKCSKNAFRSEIVKVTQFRKRFHVTGDNLEKFYGLDDHEVNKHDAAVEFQDKLREITCRWGDPQEIGAIKYIISCICEDEHDKNSAIMGAAYAWGISFELSKFFYTWSLVAMRDAMYNKIHVPFTEQDLFRHENSYTHLVDLLDIITWDQLKRLIATRGGMRFKIPTIAQMARLKERHDTFREIDVSDKDPDSIANIAKKRKKTVRTAQESYYEMVEMLNPDRSGEFPLYE